MARWMGADSLGIYVLAFSWSLLLSTATGLGFPAASLRFIGENVGSGNRGLIKGFIRHSRITVLLSSGITAVIGAGLIFLLDDVIPASYQQAMLITMACIPILTLFRLQDKIAHAYSWFGLAFAPSMAIRPLLFLILVAAVFYLQKQLSAGQAMGLQFIALALVTLIQYLLIRPRLARELGSADEQYVRRGWTTTAIPLLITTLFVQYFPELSVALIGTLLPSADVAIFYSCFRIALFIGFVLTAVNALLTPQISRLHSAGKLQELQARVTQTTRLKFASAILFLALLGLFGRTILSWFGQEFVSGYDTLIILAASQLILAATGPVDQLLNLTGHHNRSLIAFSSSIPFAIVLMLFFVPLMGINGAALVILLTALFWNLWLHYAVVKHLGIYPSVFARANRLVDTGA
jgi:O-antigen/teichoic acid export membrane protein